MDAKEYILKHTVKTYENDYLPNERVYSTYKGALLGSLYYNEIGWFENTILYRGMTPFDFRIKHQGTKDWFELPLFPPDFNRHKYD